MDVLTIFVSPGTGDLYHDILNAISSICATNTFMSMVQVGAILGFFWMIMSTIYKQTHIPTMHYTITIFLLTSLVLVPKVTIYIHDPGKMTTNRRVDNIPIGIGLFASSFSHIGYSITEAFESNFSLVDDLKYQQNGVLMGSRMISEVTRSKITDPTLSTNMNRFIKRCIVFGMGTGHYNVSTIKESTDIWGYIKGVGASSLIGVYYDDAGIKDIIPCNRALHELDKSLTNKIQNSHGFLARRMGISNDNLFKDIEAAFTSGTKISTQDADSRMGISNDNLLKDITAAFTSGAKLSELDANKGTKILKQAMVINAMDRGFTEAGGSVSRNVYAEAKSDIHTRMAYHATKRQAEQWLPIMKTILEIIFLGAFPLVFLAMLMPEGSTVLINYLLGLFWLQTWDPLYAILNRIMHGVSSFKTSQTMSLMNSDAGLALVNIAEVATINDDLIAMAGYLSLSVPFLAYAVVRGGAGSFMSLATSMLGVPQSSAIAASGEAAAGNISLGNTSIDTHVANTMSANKQNLSSFYDNHGVQVRNSLGMNMHETVSGRTLMHEEASKLSNFNAQTISSTQQQLSSQAAESHRHAENYDRSADMYQGYAAVKGLQSMSSQTRSANSTDNFARDHSSDHVKHAQQYLSDVKSFAENNKLSTDHAASIFGSIGAGMGKSDFIKANASISGNASLGSLYDTAKSYSEANNMQEAWNVGLKYAQNSAYAVNQGHQDQYLKSAQENLNDSRNLREHAQEHYAKEESTSMQASKYSSISHTIFKDGTQDFVDWALKSPFEGGAGISSAELSQVMSSNDINSPEFKAQNKLIDDYVLRQGAIENSGLRNHQLTERYNDMMSGRDKMTSNISDTISHKADKVWEGTGNLNRKEFTESEKTETQRQYIERSDKHNEEYRQLKNIPEGANLVNNIGIVTDTEIMNEAHDMEVNQRHDKIANTGRVISDGVNKKIDGGVSGHIVENTKDVLSSLTSGGTMTTGKELDNKTSKKDSSDAD